MCFPEVYRQSYSIANQRCFSGFHLSPAALACNRTSMSVVSISVQLIIVHDFPQDGNAIFPQQYFLNDHGHTQLRPCTPALFILPYNRGNYARDLELTLRFDGLVFGVCGYEGHVITTFP
jgi:hypothetical protein